MASNKPMQKKSPFLILTILLWFNGYSQFIVTEQPAVVDYFSALIPQNKANQFQFLALRDNNQSLPTRKSHQIMTYDINGQLLDSINIPKGFNPVSFPFKSNGYYYWSAVYYDTIITPVNSQDAYLLKFDSLFNCIENKKLNNITHTTEIPSNVIKINNKLFVSVKNYINNSLKFYCLDTQLNKRDSIILNGNYNVVELRKTFDENILIAGYGFPASMGVPSSQKIIMDTLLNINSVFNLDSLTYVTAGGTPVTGCSSQIGVNALYFKVVPITSTKNFIFGSYDVVYDASCNDKSNLVHSIIDNTNHILKTTLVSDSTRGIKYADNVNYVDFKGDYIYSVGSAGFNGGILQANNSNILICKSDTMGNLIWKKSYGDDMFYRPVSIIQTLDSGFLVSGLRYNYLAPVNPGVGENFILRLNKNGDLISTGVKEQGNINYLPIKCFPNPTKDMIYFDLPFASNYQIDVYDALSKIVYSNKSYFNKIPVNTELFNAGIYIYIIKTSSNYYSGKFIKE